MLAMRCSDIRPTEVCKLAEVSRTTFYAHYNHKNVIEQYESKLKDKFFARVPEVALKKITVFVLLLSFIRDERGYFEATAANANFWLLKTIFTELYPVLRAKDCSQRTYDSYTMQQIGLIVCWTQHEDFAFEKIRSYAQKMAQIPMMRMD